MRRYSLCFILCFVATFAAGCGNEPPAVAGQQQQTTLPTPVAVNFDPASCGNITGLVTWVGTIPETRPALQAIPRSDGSGIDTRMHTLANAPRIDRVTRALDGAVIFLREVNPATAKPWDLPPTAVEFRDGQLVVKQSGRVAQSGFVRRGDAVEMRSTEPSLHILRARGAEFFALAFPQPDQPLTRTFDTCGRVELTSAAGYYWQAANLFVCDHPYYALSDGEGRFQFKQVPTGRYELVAWHPNWNIIRTERNPESGLPFRLIFAPPVETSRLVEVTRGRTTLANLTFPK